MKKSKQASEALEGDDGVDFISNLPDRALQLILSGIPSTEEVIRTSILSRRWRYLWTLVPSIDIHCFRRVDALTGLARDGFKKFVYWVLLNKPLNLDSFCLGCADYYNMSTIRRWIHAAVVRKVKVLELMFFAKGESEDFEMPHCLVTCGSLEVIRLCLPGYRLCFPKFTGFQALRVLELKNVLLEEDDLEKFILESCPLLEDLSLLHWDAYDLVISSPKLKNLRIENGERIYDVNPRWFVDSTISSCLTISCPKLVFLNLTGSLASVFIFENLYSLKKAVIHIKGHLFDSEEASFDEICDVESLSINLYCLITCYHPIVNDPTPLPNLKTLEITVDCLEILIPFLKCVPALQSLHLIFIKNVLELDKWNLEETETINILTCYLKKVEFLEFDEEKLVVARDLLEHGNALEEMVFSWGDKAKFYERSMETMNQVSKFHKASSAVKLSCVIKLSQAYPRPAPKILEVDSSSCSSNSSVNSSSCSSNSSVKLLDSRSS